MSTVVATADSSLVPAFAAAREICRRDGRDLYFASFFLPADKRDAVYALFAFARMIDEAIDVDDAPIATADGLREHPVVVSPVHLSAGEVSSASCCSTGGLDARLAMFRDRLDEIYAAPLELPAIESRSPAQHALAAFAHTVHQYDIPRQYFLDLAEGRRADLTIARYPTWARLEKQCYLTAGVLGAIACAILGVQSSASADYAIKLGNAMRLTSIFRDLKSDHARGRIYLPLEDLARFAYSDRDLAAGVINENFRALMKFQIARARNLYREGGAGICWLAGEGSRLAAATLVTRSAAILDAIEQADYDVFARRAELSLAQKALRLPAAWKLARRQDGEPMPDVF